MRSDLKREYETKEVKKISKYKNFTAKNEYLNLKAHSKNVKEQSDKTLTTRICFLLTRQRTESLRQQIQ